MALVFTLLRRSATRLLGAVVETGETSIRACENSRTLAEKDAPERHLGRLYQRIGRALRTSERQVAETQHSDLPSIFGRAPGEGGTEMEVVMPAVKTRRGSLAFCGLALGLRLLIGQSVPSAYGAEYESCKFFSQLPDDCAGAEHRRFDNLRDYRYEEIDLFARDPLKKVLYVSTYNTTGQNDGDETRDSAPKALAQSVDPKRVAKKYQALLAWISPPRYWTLDWLSDRVGAVRNFDGLDAAWMGNSLAPSAAASSPAYRIVRVARTAVEGFKKGSEVYLLDDPKGRTWVMVAYTDKDSPGLTIDKLDSLGDVLKLPQGWKFRTETLAKELILEPKAGFTAATQDDKGNIYHLTGPGQSNFVP
jgi:hypothetical protein